MMKKQLKKTVLIAYPGESSDKNYCPGVFVDIDNYKEYLTSPLGGGWIYDPYDDKKSEIKIFSEDITRKMLLTYLENLKYYDYVIIAFCGHGGYSSRCQQTVLEIGPCERIYESELIDIGFRENLILDCCRIVLADTITESIEHFGLKIASAPCSCLDLNKCRRLYDYSISQCGSGTNILYGCNIKETSGESKDRGGYFSSSLIRTAKRWQQKYILKNNQILSILDAFQLAIPFVTAKKVDQNPQIFSCYSPFPWGVISY